MEKKILALDIGQVCISIHPERCFARLGFRSAAEVPPELLRISCDEFECGRLSDAEFLAAARKLIGTTLSDAELAAALAAIIGGPLPGMNELVFSLPARGIQPVFFSDTSALHLAEVRRKFPAAAVVPEGIYSFEVGARKPARAMFEAFESRFGRPVLYVDDRPELIEGAAKFGWNALRFTGADALERALFPAD